MLYHHDDGINFLFEGLLSSYSFKCVLLTSFSTATLEITNKEKCHFCYGEEEKIDIANDATTNFLGLPCCDSCYLQIIDLEAKIMDVLVKDGFFENQRCCGTKKQQIL
jgi:hypothetical protein